MRLGLLLVGVVLVGGVLTGGAFATSDSPISSALGGSDAAAAANGNTTGTGGENVSMGTALSSYMQSQSAKAAGAVGQGMWNASFSQKRSAAAVERRAAALREQLESVRERRQRLQAAYENGTISEMQYRARMANLDARLDALSQAVDETRPAAKAVGANVSRLDAIGNAIAKAQRKVPEHAGPPETPPGRTGDTGPGANGSSAPGNGVGNAPGQGNQTAPGQANGTVPGKSNQTAPGKGNQTVPGQANQTAPSKGNQTVPGQANRTAPSKSNQTVPGQANRTVTGQANASNVSNTTSGKLPPTAANRTANGTTGLTDRRDASSVLIEKQVPGQSNASDRKSVPAVDTRDG